MEIFNRHTSKNTGNLDILTSWMLIGPQNSSAKNVSIQISENPAGSGQPVHRHGPEQCYYIIQGTGLMTIENETEEVSVGDAVHIPSNAQHGMKNIGSGVLEYLTVNSPVFSEQYKNNQWPSSPSTKT